ncbi:MAG: hypothetical protein ACK56I_21990, partial [bacterium]
LSNIVGLTSSRGVLAPSGWTGLSRSCYSDILTVSPRGRVPPPRGPAALTSLFSWFLPGGSQLSWLHPSKPSTT